MCAEIFLNISIWCIQHNLLFYIIYPVRFCYERYICTFCKLCQKPILSTSAHLRVRTSSLQEQKSLQHRGKNPLVLANTPLPSAPNETGHPKHPSHHPSPTMATPPGTARHTAAPPHRQRHKGSNRKNPHNRQVKNAIPAWKKAFSNFNCTFTSFK